MFVFLNFIMTITFLFYFIYFANQNVLYLIFFFRHVVSYFNFSEEHMQILYEFPLNKLAELEYSTDNTRVCSENLPLCTEVTEKTEKPKVLEDCDSAVEQDDEKKMETECVDIPDDVVKNRSPADSKKEADTSRNGSTKEDIAMKKADEAMDEDGGVQEEEGRKRKAQELKEVDRLYCEGSKNNFLM